MNAIEVTNLTKYYGKSRGIVDVSFSQEKGEIFGFIGPNGAGKSTTIRLLLSLIHPTSGSARIFGKDVVSQGPLIRRDIGYLPSEVFYYEGMKVIAEEFVRQRLAAPHTWHAAEVFLYLIGQTSPGN